MWKTSWIIFMVAGLLAADAAYTFLQHRMVALDGDMASIILPAPHYAPVLKAPFGLPALKAEAPYASPNRYFVHRALYHYYRAVPAFFSRLTSKIEAVYLSSAIAKTASHIALLLLLSCLAGRGYPWRAKLWAALWLAPLFQSAGYYAPVMGIVEPAPTYTFFYAWPAVLMLSLLSLLARRWQRPAGGWGEVAGMAGLCVVLPFTGPLVAGVVATGFLLVLGIGLEKRWALRPGLPIQKMQEDLPLSYWAGLGGLALLSAYSLYLGTLSSEQQAQVGLWARYQRLPAGLWKMLTNKLALPLLFGGLAWQIGWLRYLDRQAFRAWWDREARYLVLFMALYLLLVPLGGYRDYRPEIIRRDTLQPVLLVLFYLWGRTGIRLLLASGGAAWRLLPTAALLVLFTVADLTRVTGDTCQRQALQQLANEDQPRVVLPRGCPVLTWAQVSDQDTQWPSELLVLWGILKEGQRFEYRD